MNDLPRSRALMRLDGPGHIMPIEPVTPPDSALWRIVHLPPILAAVATGLLFLGALAIGPLGLGVRVAGHVTGGRYIVSLIGATAIVVVYRLFVRVVERRSDLDEFGSPGWLEELGLGFCGGLALAFASFAILYLLGDLRIVGFNSPTVMLAPFVTHLCIAVILEITVCGLGFRLIERMLGSWMTLLLFLVFFGGARLLADDATLSTVLAVALQAGLLFAVVYMMTRRLWAAIGLHAAWTFGQIGLYGDAMTANGPRGFVLTSIVGPDWLTGGDAGATDSVPAIAISMLLIITMLVVTVRRGRIVRPVWRRGRNA